MGGKPFSSHGHALAPSDLSMALTSETENPVPCQTLQDGRRERESMQLRQQCLVERSNLLNLTKLIVKALVEASMRGGQPPSDTNPAVKHLFTMLEQVMSHKLKGEQFSIIFI